MLREGRASWYGARTRRTAMWRRRHSDKPAGEPAEAAPSDSLAAECEAFLAGRYAAHAGALGARVPVWAWVNVLAHASEDGIAALAAGEPWWPNGAARPAHDW